MNEQHGFRDGERVRYRNRVGTVKPKPDNYPYYPRPGDPHMIRHSPSALFVRFDDGTADGVSPQRLERIEE